MKGDLISQLHLEFSFCNRKLDRGGIRNTETLPLQGAIITTDWELKVEPHCFGVINIEWSFHHTELCVGSWEGSGLWPKRHRFSLLFLRFSRFSSVGGSSRAMCLYALRSTSETIKGCMGFHKLWLFCCGEVGPYNTSQHHSGSESLTLCLHLESYSDIWK